MQPERAFIGTSGWHYPHWESIFYPADLKKKDQLEYYTSKFKTVELNNSFYRQPKKANFEAWRDSIPDDFIFAVKANRYFTHLKKLKVTAADVNNFFDACTALGEKLGPILFQLPPKWKLNIERLDSFLKTLPQGFQYTFEFRESSWYTPAVYDLLEQHNCAFCIYHLAGHQSPILTTANFVYVRLHGPGDKYQGKYDQKQLTEWAKLAKKWLAERKQVYFYFDNDQDAYAAMNALDLQEMINE
jgi:uncharacterized protein YecE (DUF72 family)